MSDKLTWGRRGFARVVLACFLGGFSTFQQLYCVQAILPAFAKEFRLGAAGASLSMSIATLVMAFCLPFAGIVAGRFGRKRVMIVSMFLASMGTLMTAFAPTWGVLLGLRALMGLALAGLPSLTVSYLAETIEAPALGFAVGLNITGSTLGGMFGRLVTGFLSDFYGWRVALIGMGGSALLGTLVFSFVFPPERGCLQGGDLRSLWRQLKNHFCEPALPFLFAVGYCAQGAFVCTYNLISFRLAAAPFCYSARVISLIFTLYVIGAISSTVMGDFAGRAGRRRVLWTAPLTGMLGILITIPDHIASVALGVALVTWSFFASHSIASSWVGLRVNVGRAEASALYLFFFYIGSSLNGWVGGGFYQAYGWSGLVVFVEMLLGISILSALALKKTPPPFHMC